MIGCCCIIGSMQIGRWLGNSCRLLLGEGALAIRDIKGVVVRCRGPPGLAPQLPTGVTGTPLERRPNARQTFRDIYSFFLSSFFFLLAVRPCDSPT